MASLSGVFLMLAYCISHTTGEIRCYCNEPKCVTSGYMCKSSVINSCYVIKSIEGSTTRGCADTLLTQGQNLCNDVEYKRYHDNRAREAPVVHCCKDDMCNYNVDVIVNVQPNSSSINEKNEIQNPGPPGTYIHYTKPEVGGRQPEHDLWFKAAVIAVPIAGGFILILLVLLAVRMLRSDSRRHRQLIQIRRERTSLTKAQLYVTDHFCEKIENTTSPLFGGKQNPVYRTEKDAKIYDKMSDRTKSKNTYPSFSFFGKAPKKDFATVV